MPRVAVITVSDRVSRGTGVDRSGPAIAERLRRRGMEVEPVQVVPDEPAELEAAIRAATAWAQLVVTTGGTGISPRDHTPEVTARLADYTIPGMAEEMRRRGREKTPMAVLSRGVVAVVAGALVINLPGSEAGAVENLEALLEVIPHALDQLAGGGH